MKNKVVLVYKDIEGGIAEETIWVQPIGEHFKVDNIPFYAPNIALDDIISVEDDEGTLYFDELIKPSGHSTIQIIFFNEKDAEIVLKRLEKLGCKWEGMKNTPYFAIDIPPTIAYKEIRQFLDEQFKNKVLDFKEACLSDNHN
jgi:hypothetical protein